MKKVYIIGLVLISLIFISACTSSNQGSQIAASGNSVQEQKLSIGINKGDTPPDFTITTIDNKQYTLSNFKNEKPILLYFWASWCPYCSQDFDVVKNIYPKYSDKVAFLAIDLDLNEDANLIQRYKD